MAAEAEMEEMNDGTDHLEGSPPFIETIGENGKISRECCASQECMDKKVRYERRCLLIRHLKNVHRITDVHVPEHRTGRPKAGERPPHPVSPSSTRQCEKRSLSIDHRIKVARRKYHNDLKERATKEWNRTWDKKGRSQPQWERSWIKAQKAQWEAGMEKRVAKMTKNIAQGYKPRKVKVPKANNEPEEDDSADEDEDAFEIHDDASIHVGSPSSGSCSTTVTFLIGHNQFVCQDRDNDHKSYMERLAKAKLDIDG